MTKSSFVLFVGFALLLLTSACASFKSCPTVEAEGVSMCRAQQDCGGAKATAGVAVGTFFAQSDTNNPADDTYDQCVSRNMATQREVAKNRETLHIYSEQLSAEAQDIIDHSGETGVNGDRHSRVKREPASLEKPE